MAQNYEIDIKRFNGQDYDTLLPTPASHASTHQADGSDPLTLQAGNYGALSIPTSAYQNASVTRAKLANNALYSPIVGSVDTRYITSADIGKTLKSTWNAAMTLTITQENSANIPEGAEFAVLRWGNSSGDDCKIIADGTRLLFTGDDTLHKNGIAKISDAFGMIALKKTSSDPTQGDSWLVTGNAEVVS